MNTCIKLTILFHFDFHVGERESSFFVGIIECEFYGIMNISDFRNEIMQVLLAMILYHENFIKERFITGT